jgi:RNA polymerase sigma-70 factor (ECF subfamily)
VSEDAWRSAWQGARAAWPGVTVAPARLDTFLAERPDARVDHAADLYLACGVLAGDAAAVRAFDAHVLAGIDPAVRRVDAAASFVDEVRQALRVRLLVGERGAPPRIAGYQGRGPLLGWVRVAALRLALNRKRADKAAVATEDVLGEIVAGEPDPELRQLKTLYRSELSSALAAALAALPERSRAVLRLHYVEGLKLAQIAGLYGVHESTASRWASDAVERVAADTRRRLVERLALSADSADSLARMVRSQLDLSIGRLLGSA